MLNGHGKVEDCQVVRPIIAVCMCAVVKVRWYCERVVRHYVFLCSGAGLRGCVRCVCRCVQTKWPGD